MTDPDPQTTIPDPPEGTTESGRVLWAAVLDRYELDPGELPMLIEIVRTMRYLDELDTILRTEGAMQDSPQGRRAHPAAAAARDHRIILARLTAALRLPTEDAPGAKRPQRRPGVRTPYALRGSA